MSVNPESRERDVAAALQLIEDWLPPMGMTSIPDEPIKPAQANALHKALRDISLALREAHTEDWNWRQAVARAEAAEAREAAKERELQFWSVGIGPGPARMKELRDGHRALSAAPDPASARQSDSGGE